MFNRTLIIFIYGSLTLNYNIVFRPTPLSWNNNSNNADVMVNWDFGALVSFLQENKAAPLQQMDGVLPHRTL